MYVHSMRFKRILIIATIIITIAMVCVNYNFLLMNMMTASRTAKMKGKKKAEKNAGPTETKTHSTTI